MPFGLVVPSDGRDIYEGTTRPEQSPMPFGLVVPSDPEHESLKPRSCLESPMPFGLVVPSDEEMHAKRRLSESSSLQCLSA